MIPVIGFGQIIFYDGVVTDYEIRTIQNAMEVNDAFHNVQLDGRAITFEMSGNKGIDYTELIKIKEILEEKEANFKIQVSEYMECEGTGFYYDSDDNEHSG